MTRKLIVALAALALLAFGAAACGGDDDDDAPEVTPPVEEAPPPGDEAEEPTGGDGRGGTLEVEADPGDDLSYTTGALSTGAGEVTIEFDNPASIQHDVRIETPDGEDVGGTEIITDDSATASVDLEPGDYLYYCSVPGHRAAGMEEELTVE